MHIYGLDFTSAPGREKPITCVGTTLIEQTLHVESLVLFECFDTFENFLGSPGPWIAAMDFPFGQPKKLRVNLGWPERWDAIARLVGDLSAAEFEAILTEYREPREPGDKHHLRHTDELAGAQSSMMLYGVPVGKMFHRGVPLLERSRVNIIPCRPLNKDRYVVEGYPALVARRYIDKTKYKSDKRSQQSPECEDARRALLDILQGPRLEQDFGLTLDLPNALSDEFIADATADRLDALLCAIQSAWAWTRRDQNFGVPVDADPAEGWIVDPGLVNDSTDAAGKDAATGS